MATGQAALGAMVSMNPVVSFGRLTNWKPAADLSSDQQTRQNSLIVDTGHSILFFRFQGDTDHSRWPLVKLTRTP